MLKKMTKKKTNIHSKDEIFNWLIRNSLYYEPCYSSKEIKKILKDNEQDGVSLECAINNVPPFHAKLKKFEAFLGEPYSFAKHLLPLIKSRMISCSGIADTGLYATKQYKNIFDTSLGCVKDYKTNEDFVCFWIGPLPLSQR